MRALALLPLLLLAACSAVELPVEEPIDGAYTGRFNVATGEAEVRLTLRENRDGVLTGTLVLGDGRDATPYSVRGQYDAPTVDVATWRRSR